jgi:hypothetical protein
MLRQKEIDLKMSDPKTQSLAASWAPTTFCPEQVLLLAACRSGGDPDALRSVQTLVGQSTDWSYLVSLAKSHAVLPLLAQGLKSLNHSTVPRDIQASLETFCAEQRKRNLLLTAELVRILAALQNRGIVAMPFKGPLLGQMVYRDLGLRSFADLDFLIQDKDISPCMEALAELGYPEGATLTKAQSESRWRKNGQRLLTRKDGLVAIEPHVRLAPATLGLRIDYSGIWSRAITADLGGTKVLSLAPEDLLMMLCVHGSKDQWSQLSWICDVAQTMHAFSALDWNGLLDRARSQRCLRIVLLGLLLANRFRGDPLPGAVAAIVSSDHVVSELADSVERTIFATNHLVPSIWKVSRFRIEMHDGFRGRLSYVTRTIVTPGSHHAGLISLPRPLYFAYYPIKLVFDYVFLPIWRVKKALS